MCFSVSVTKARNSLRPDLRSVDCHRSFKAQYIKLLYPAAYDRQPHIARAPDSHPMYDFSQHSVNSTLYCIVLLYFGTITMLIISFRKFAMFVT